MMGMKAGIMQVVLAIVPENYTLNLLKKQSLQIYQTNVVQG
jgi:hypothetical protein